MVLARIQTRCLFSLALLGRARVRDAFRAPVHTGREEGLITNRFFERSFDARARFAAYRQARAREFPCASWATRSPHLFRRCTCGNQITTSAPFRATASSNSAPNGLFPTNDNDLLSSKIEDHKIRRRSAEALRLSDREISEPHRIQPRRAGSWSTGLPEPLASCGMTRSSLEFSRAIVIRFRVHGLQFMNCALSAASWIRARRRTAWLRLPGHD